MRTITLSNQKGGVAKTTTAFAIATTLQSRNNRVLAIDLDPQSNLSFACGIDTIGRKCLYDVFKETVSINDVITHTKHGFDLICGGLSLAGADMDFTRTGREFMLAECLSRIEASYDYCIIDTPPTLGILTVNALTASNDVIVPMTADVYSIQGLAQLNALILNVRKYCNRSLRIAGLLLTKYNDRQNVSRALHDQIETAAKQLNTKVFKTPIRESVAVRESQLMQTDMFREAPKANATVDYLDFIEELIEE